MHKYITVSPSEGVIEGGETLPLKFTFAPQNREIAKGFRSRVGETEGIQSFRIMMQVKVIGSGSTVGDPSGLTGMGLDPTAGVGVGEVGALGTDPIDLILTGEAHPLSVTLSPTSLHFPATTPGKAVGPVHEGGVVRIWNGSERLGVRFWVGGVAGVKVMPSEGFVGPRSRTDGEGLEREGVKDGEGVKGKGFVDLKVMWKPNQLGALKGVLYCEVEGVGGRVRDMEGDQQDGSEEGEGEVTVDAEEVWKKIGGKCGRKGVVLQRIPINLFGLCVPEGKTVNDGANPQPIASGKKDLKSSTTTKSKRKSTATHLNYNTDPHPKSNPDWESKSNHRHQYASYLISSRIERIKSKRLEYFGGGDDGVWMDFSKRSVREDYSRVDPESGLTEPEPDLMLDSSVSSRTPTTSIKGVGMGLKRAPRGNNDRVVSMRSLGRDVTLRKASADDSAVAGGGFARVLETNSRTMDGRRMRELFEKLQEPVVHRLRMLPTTAGHASITTAPSTAAGTGVAAVGSVPSTAAAGKGAAGGGGMTMGVKVFNRLMDCDIPLNAADLGQIFTARSVIDFGEVTVHSVNKVPINFLNALAQQSIHIALIVEDSHSNNRGPTTIPTTLSSGGPRASILGVQPLTVKSASTTAIPREITISPPHQIIPPQTVLGFEATLTHHTPGTFTSRITYVINGRYRFHIAVRAVVKPVSLVLSETRVAITFDSEDEVRRLGQQQQQQQQHGVVQQSVGPANAQTFGVGLVKREGEVPMAAEVQVHGQQHGKVVTIATEVGETAPHSAASTYGVRQIPQQQQQDPQHNHRRHGESGSQRPTAEKTIRLTNPGNYPARFRWVLPTPPATTTSPTGAKNSRNGTAKKDGGRLLSSPRSRREQQGGGGSASPIRTRNSNRNVSPSPPRYGNIPQQQQAPEMRSEGLFSVYPREGIIPPHGSASVSLSFVPGVNPVTEETLQLHVIDDWEGIQRGPAGLGAEGAEGVGGVLMSSTKKGEKVSDVLTLECRGEVPTTTCVMMVSTKQGPLDLGVLSVGYSSQLLEEGGAAGSTSGSSGGEGVLGGVGGGEHDPWPRRDAIAKLLRFNVFASPLLALPVVSLHSSLNAVGIHPAGNGGGTSPESLGAANNPSSITGKPLLSRGSRTFKVKNTSPHPCFFIAHLATSSNEIEVSPRSGIIEGRSGTVDITVSILPARVGVFENAVVVKVVGAGKIYRVPFRYESRIPEVEITTPPPATAGSMGIAAGLVGGGDMEASNTVVGTWSTRDLHFCNRSGVVSRVVVDLRERPEFGFQIKVETSISRMSASASRRTGSSGTNKKTSGSAGTSRSFRSPTHESSIYLEQGEKSGMKQGSGVAVVPAGAAGSFAGSQQPDTTGAAGLKNRAGRIKVISEKDELFYFDEVQQEGKLGSTKTLAKTNDSAVDILPSPPTATDKEKNSAGNEKQQIAPKKGSLFIFDLHPGEFIVGQLVFRPLVIARHTFDLPIYVLGVAQLSPKYIPVVAQSCPSPLSISRTHVDFKNKVVFRNFNASGVFPLSTAPAKETLTLTNNSAKPLDWWLDVSSLEYHDGVFGVDKTHGTISAFESFRLTLFFQPDTTGFFESHISLHVQGLAQKTPFAISLHGSGVEPSLAFDPPEIFLPVVPLGGECTATFSIINYGCERTEVKHNVQHEATLLNRHGSLQLMFPEGKLLKGDGERLTVVLKFVSGVVNTNNNGVNDNTNDKGDGKKGSLGGKGAATIPALTTSAPRATGPAPVSFTTKIEFLGNNGHRTFYIPVHGTADSSFLTLQTYFWTTRSNCGFLIKDPSKSGPVVYERVKSTSTQDESHNRARILSTPRVAKTPCGVRLDVQSEVASYAEYLTMLGGLLTKWLQDHLGVSSYDAYSFPAQFVTNGGRMIYDLILSVSGRKAPGQVSVTVLAAPLHDRVKYLHRQYVDLLNHLKSMGALLNAVKPEFLLSPDEYRTLVQQRVDQMKSEAGSFVHDELLQHHQVVQNHFDVISKEAWCTLLLQIVKVFVSQTVTVKSFKSLQGVGADESELPWAALVKGSNVYGVAENVLLKWASYHYYKHTGIVRRFVNFATDFQDSLAIAYLLISYIPSLTEHFVHLHKDCILEEHYEENAMLLLDALSQQFSGCSGITKLNVATILGGTIGGASPISVGGMGAVTGTAPASNALTAKSLSTAFEMYLLLLFLYQTLPSFVPRETIEFHGHLNETIVREVELCNSGSKMLTYLAELEGSKDFALGIPSSVDEDGLRFSQSTAPGSPRLGNHPKHSQIYNSFMTNTRMTHLRPHIMGSVATNISNMSKADLQEHPSIFLPTKGQVSIPLQFRGRFSGHMEAQLTLKSMRMGLNSASIMVFTLRSLVEPPTPVKVFKTEAPLYGIPPVQVGIDIINPFAQRGQFQIQLKQSKKLYRHAKMNNSYADEKGHTKHNLNPVENVNPPAFRLSQNFIELEPYEVATIPVSYLPFDYAMHECVFHFFDEEVGEFLYAIEGHTSLPQIVESMLWTCKAATTLSKTLQLTHQNVARDRAINYIIQQNSQQYHQQLQGANAGNGQQGPAAQAGMVQLQHQGQKDGVDGGGGGVVVQTGNKGKGVQIVESKKEGVGLQGGKSGGHVSPAPKDGSNGDAQNNSNGKSRGVKGYLTAVTTERDLYQLPKTPLRYRGRNTVNLCVASSQFHQCQSAYHNNDKKVEYSSPFFQGPPEVTINPRQNIADAKDKRRILALDHVDSILDVRFTPKLPGKYTGRIVLYGIDTSDVRIFNINGMAISEGSKAEIEFTCPARQSVKQEIPIVNPTDEDWNVKAHLQGQYFTGVLSFTVWARSTSIYTITFRPQKACDVSGVLTLSTLSNSPQRHIYHLRGVGLEALPEEQREIVCQARQTITQIFQVRNYTDFDAEYDVITDFPPGHMRPKHPLAPSPHTLSTTLPSSSPAPPPSTGVSVVSGGGTTGVEGVGTGTMVKQQQRLFIPAGQAVQCELAIYVPVSGTVTRHVMFVNLNDRSNVWYILK
ncbi:Cilia- and flagella-associated protein 47, partial [Quaeritorhiza haematococci]